LPYILPYIRPRGTVNGFLEQIERMIAYPTRLFLSDPRWNPFNPLFESVDSRFVTEKEVMRIGLA